MTSCMFTSSSCESDAQVSIRFASSGVQANSLRNDVGMDLVLPSITFESETDLLPYVSRIF